MAVPQTLVRPRRAPAQSARSLGSLLEFPVGRIETVPAAKLVLVRAIPFQSLCEEHLLPFFGVVHVGYLRGENRLSEAELARIVDACAGGVQVQQKMTTRIGLWLDHQLASRGVGVLVEGGYACTPVRDGAALAGPTTTMAFYGSMRDSATEQREFLTLARGKATTEGPRP